jgi:hypothetical protein
MKEIPHTVNDHIKNGHYYLDVAATRPSPAHDAAHILFLLIAWENIAIADAELGVWASGERIDPKVHKDHAFKFQGVPKITRIIVAPKGSGREPEIIDYTTGKEFATLRMVCQYGPKGGSSKDVSQIFQTGHWFTDEFKNALIAKLGWVEMLVDIYKREVFHE